jgi:hypothetical protein
MVVGIITVMDSDFNPNCDRHYMAYLSDFAFKEEA